MATVLEVMLLIGMAIVTVMTDNVSNCSSPTYYTLPDEADNGWVHTSLQISMAKTSQPNTGGSQFFLIPAMFYIRLDGIHTVFGEASGCEHITTWRRLMVMIALSYQ